MSRRTLQAGDLVTVRFPLQTPQGHEQEGYRPAIVVGVPTRLGKPRFPVVLVVPLTTYRNQPWVKESPQLYPCLPASTTGLSAMSVVLLDQIRVIDAKRISNYRGSLTAEQYGPILTGIEKMVQANQAP